VGSPAGKYLVFLIQIQLSGAPRERARLRDKNGELQVIWGGEQGEARGGMLQGVLEEEGAG
jgi:hypothetical protein